MGAMWWAEVQRKQFILCLYYYVRLRKQTAWKQTEGATQRGGRSTSSPALRQVDPVDQSYMYVFYHSPSNGKPADMHVTPNEFPPEDERNGECAI